MSDSFYVNMVDGVCSGFWRRSGYGRASGRSILIVKCETLAQADAIERAAYDMTGMSRISVTTKPRRGKPGDDVSIKAFATMSGPWLRFYTPGT